MNVRKDDKSLIQKFEQYSTDEMRMRTWSVINK